MQRAEKVLIAVSLVGLIAAAPKQSSPSRSAPPIAVAKPKPISSLDPSTTPCTGNATQDRKSALCAQWVAADAATYSALWAKLYVAISIVSAGGLITALLLTLRSNKIARAAIDAESRPWVHIEDIDIEQMCLSQDGNGSLLMTGSIRLINVGKTTAANVGIRWGLSPTPQGAIRLCTVPTPLPSARSANLLPNVSKITDIMEVTTLDKAVLLDGGTSYIGVEIVYTAPGSDTPRFLREIWTLGSKIFRGTVTTLGTDKLLAGEMVKPITQLIKTIEMT